MIRASVALLLCLVLSSVVECGASQRSDAFLLDEGDFVMERSVEMPRQDGDRWDLNAGTTKHPIAVITTAAINPSNAAAVPEAEITPSIPNSDTKDENDLNPEAEVTPSIQKADTKVNDTTTAPDSPPDANYTIAEDGSGSGSGEVVMASEDNKFVTVLTEDDNGLIALLVALGVSFILLIAAVSAFSYGRSQAAASAGYSPVTLSTLNSVHEKLVGDSQV